MTVTQLGSRLTRDNDVPVCFILPSYYEEDMEEGSEKVNEKSRS